MARWTVTTERNILLNGLPSKVAGYTRSVILPRPGFKPGDTIPPVNVTRRGFKIDENHLAKFHEMCGGEPSKHLPFVYPLTLLFHYHLGIFAHRDFPWSLRKLLGLRDHVVQRRRIAVGESLDLEARTASQRVLPKGVEFDIHTVLSSGGESVWESVHVYYLRGSFGGADVRPAVDYLQPFDTAEFETSWDAPAGRGWDFARLSGDFNPVHYLTPWAKFLGFKRDFSHTQRIVSDCVRRLPEPPEAMDAEPLRLDVAFKGPVYYGGKLVMKGVKKGNGYRFDLYSDNGNKPAIPGNIQRVKADHGLFAQAG